MTKPLPLGCFQCDICRAVSEVYAYPIQCAECMNSCCEDCAVGDVDSDETGTHAPSCLVCESPLLSAVRAASMQHMPPTHYRPATREAYQLTRQAVRDAIASEWRETLKASAQLPREVTTYQRDGCWYDTTDTNSRFQGD